MMRWYCRAYANNLDIVVEETRRSSAKREIYIRRGRRSLVASEIDEVELYAFGNRLDILGAVFLYGGVNVDV